MMKAIFSNLPTHFSLLPLFDFIAFWWQQWNLRILPITQNLIDNIHSYIQNRSVFIVTGEISGQMLAAIWCMAMSFTKPFTPPTFSTPRYAWSMEHASVPFHRPQPFS